jgi:glycosyltransferase involved in cell wall biosynthesis
MNAPATIAAEEGIPAVIEGEPLKGRHVLIVVENLPLPFDRRVWQEARTLKAAGAHVSIICPTGKGYESRFEVIDGIEIHRHPLPLEAKGAMGFLAEYGAALFWETVLAWRIHAKRRIDVIQGCNPPDLIFLVALPFKLLGVRYIFDHHDINPELYEAKFNKRGFFWWLMVLFEKLTFMAADVSIATNHSYRKIAIERGGMTPDRVHVVRSGPDLSKLKRVAPAEQLEERPRAHGRLCRGNGRTGRDRPADRRGRSSGAPDGPRGYPVRAGRRRAGAGGVEGPHRSPRSCDFITFTGRAPDADLFEVLSTMDLGVNPDRVNAMNDKSTMNKIMEYMSLGKAMVQFDVTEGRFSAQEASLYAEANNPVDLAEKIAALVDDPAARERMGAYGRERVVNELNWQHQITPLLAAYTQALGQGLRSGPRQKA